MMRPTPPASGARASATEITRAPAAGAASAPPPRRNTDIGQTVAASFQTPDLYLLAKDLRSTCSLRTLYEARRLHRCWQAEDVAVVGDLLGAPPGDLAERRGVGHRDLAARSAAYAHRFRTGVASCLGTR